MKLNLKQLKAGKIFRKKGLFGNSVLPCKQELIAEGVGTFILVFAGTGAIVANTITDGAITHLGVSFVFGAVVAALIYTLGHISGAHFNPAVTLGFSSIGSFSRNKVIGYTCGYIGVQCLGAIAASGILRLTFGNVANLGATLPLNGNWWQAFILEIILTFILMLVILGVGLDRRAYNSFAGMAIGLTVGLDAACMGPITGASMNPARSLGPALISGVWQYHWLYWIAPILGAQLAVFVYREMSEDAKKS
ncbi:MAG: MIP/aquaporin family protein [Prochloraceae cyanobacterium]